MSARTTTSGRRLASPLATLHGWRKEWPYLIAMAATAAAALVFGFSRGAEYMCPAYKSYDDSFLSEASMEEARLPPGSALRQKLSDYDAVREQGWLCNFDGK